MVIIFLFHILFFFPDKIQLVLRGEDIFEDLDSTQTDELWRPEFASYMLEGTPGQPYGSTLKDLLKVEKVRVTMHISKPARIQCYLPQSCQGVPKSPFSFCL